MICNLFPNISVNINPTSGAPFSLSDQTPARPKTIVPKVISTMAVRRFRLNALLLLLLFIIVSLTESSSDTNSAFSPCLDAKVQRNDGFSFGIAFAGYSTFFINSSLELSPCDRRLSLSSSNSQVAVFRPKVDEISLLTINTSNFFPVPAL